MVKTNGNTEYHEVPVIQVEGQNIDDSQIPMINIVTEKKSFQVTPAVVDIDFEEEKQITDKKDSEHQNGMFYKH